MDNDVRIIEGVKKVWVTNQNLEKGLGVQAQVQAKVGRKILAVYRTESSKEGFERCFAYAEKFAEANGITVSETERT